MHSSILRYSRNLSLQAGATALTAVCLLQISGLNAPIPPGAQFGYQPGGWGKPPVDEEGSPLYGDVFGLTMEPEDEELVRICFSLFILDSIMDAVRHVQIA